MSQACGNNLISVYKTSQDNVETWLVCMGTMHNAPKHLITPPPDREEQEDKENVEPSDDKPEARILTRHSDRQHKMAISSWVPLTTFIVKHGIPVPGWIMSELKKTIIKRRQQGGSGLDTRHRRVINVLEQAWDILLPHYEATVAQLKQASK